MEHKESASGTRLQKKTAGQGPAVKGFTRLLFYTLEAGLYTQEEPAS